MVVFFGRIRIFLVRKMKPVLFIILILIPFFRVGPAGAQPAQASQLVVIAHTSVPVDSLGKGELLRLFSGDREYWETGDPVVIADLAKKGNVRESFYEYIGKTSSRMRSLWLKRKLSGEGELPESFESEDELLDMVLNTPGAIGYLRAEMIADESEIKILITNIPLLEPGD